MPASYTVNPMRIISLSSESRWIIRRATGQNPADEETQDNPHYVRIWRLDDPSPISKRCSRSSRPGRNLFRRRETWPETRLCTCKRARGLALHWDRTRGLPDSWLPRLARHLDRGIPGEFAHGGLRGNFDRARRWNDPPRDGPRIPCQPRCWRPAHLRHGTGY